MTKEEIDIMWQQALQDSVRDGEMFTRYHFAQMVAAKEREACANLCEDQAQEYYSDGSKRAMNYQCADAIRARGET